MLEFAHNHFSLGGPSVENHSPSPSRAGALKGDPEDPQRRAPQCCPWRLAGRCLVFDITSKQTVSSPVPSFEHTWDLVGAKEEREKPTPTHGKW